MKLSKLFIILLCLLQLNQSSQEEEAFTITKITNNPGVYFEKLGTIQLTNENWKLITYIDINVYMLRLESVKIRYNKLKRFCDKENSVYCNKVYTTMQRTMYKIKDDISQLKTQLGQKEQRTRRIKRGMIDTVGEAAKVLFGTMDHDDAMYYDDKIKEASYNQHELSKLEKEQAAVMISTIKIINKTINDVNNNQVSIIQSFDKIVEFQNLTRTVLQDKLNNMTIQTIINEYIELINIETFQLEIDVKELLQTIVDARQGEVHPSVINLKTLKSELESIRGKLPAGLSFPLTINDDSIHSFFDIFSVCVYIKDNKLVYVFVIPLVNDLLFELYKVSPLPKFLQNNKYVFIQPKTEYFGIDDVKQYYVYLKKNELDDCKCIRSNNFICQQTNPVYQAHLHESCEIKLFKKDSDIKNCDQRIAKIIQPLWKKMVNSNSWLYVLPEDETLTISCKIAGVPSTIQSIQLHNIGIFNLAPSCKAYGSGIMLLPTNKYESNSTKPIVPPIDFEFDCCDELDKESDNEVKLPSITLSKYFKSVVAHADDLDAASFRINEIKNLLEKEKMNEINNTNITHHSIIMYVICVAISIALMYYIYKKLFSSWLIPVFGKCCNKSLRDKLEESLEQVQTLNSRPIVVKQYQYGASIEDIAYERTKEPSEHTVEIHDKEKVTYDRKLRPRSKRL